MIWQAINPFTGKTVILSQEQKDMYVKIKHLERDINMDPDYTANNVSRNDKIDEFDKLRYKFMKKWPTEYYALLD